MITKWLVTNKDLNSELPLTIKKDRFNVYTSNKGDIYFPHSRLIEAIVIDGYILPRNHCFEKFKNYSQYELIEELFIEYGEDIVEYIKGSFNLLIISNEQFIFFNDHHSVKKSYYYQDQDEFILSNDYGLIKEVCYFDSNLLAPAIMALFQHLINGHTYIKDVFYTKASTKIKYSTEFIISQYWDRKTLIVNDKIYSQEDIAHKFVNTIRNVIEYLEPKDIHLTQTGGRDTRTILATLLSEGLKPKLFTFGFPDGRDVVVSRNIADVFGLEFNNPFLKGNASEYRENTEEIFACSNPLIHLHRAHRLDAIRKQKNRYNKMDMVFMGAMGGDYIKGVHFNDYIVSEFVRKYVFNDYNNLDDLIKSILNKHRIIYDEKILSKLKLTITEIEFLNYGNFKEKEFLIAFDLIGSLHDIQDISLFSEFADNVVCPFMDIDFLEALFQSSFSLFSHNRSSKNIFKKIQGGELQAYITKKLCPRMINIPYASGYTINDMRQNIIFYLLKRSYYKFTLEQKGTFGYKEWFLEYIKLYYNEIECSIKQYYDIDGLHSDLLSESIGEDEGNWHKYSNPIVFYEYLKKRRNL